MSWLDKIGEGLGDIVGGVTGSKAAAESQERAQKAAAKAQIKIARENREYYDQQATKGVGEIYEGSRLGIDATQLGGARAEALTGIGMGRSEGALSEGYDQARYDIGTQYGQARTDVEGLTDLQRYGEGATTGLQTGQRLGGMMDQPGGLYGGFEADPGYQFRLSQGEEAINRSAAARGGRLGGSTLKALADYSQGLASQEYGNFANRRQGEAGMAGSLDQQQLQADLAAQSNQMSLAQTGYGAQSQMAGLAAQQGSQMAGMAQGQGQDLSNLYSAGYGNQANYAYNTGSQVGSMYANRGSNAANIYTGVGAANAQNAQMAANAIQNQANSAGMSQQASANTMMQLGGLAAMYAMSDARLKTNIKTLKRSKYERIGLRGVSWTWNKKANTLGLHGESSGVIAQEVQKIYPQAVSFIGDYFAVNYEMLDAMVAKTEQAAVA